MATASAAASVALSLPTLIPVAAVGSGGPLLVGLTAAAVVRREEAAMQVGTRHEEAVEAEPVAVTTTRRWRRRG